MNSLFLVCFIFLAGPAILLNTYLGPKIVWVLFKFLKLKRAKFIVVWKNQEIGWNCEQIGHLLESTLIS